MYDPKGNGKDRAVEAVQFVETEPPAHLRGIVHRFLELKTNGALAEDYRFHALPDACTYIVFDQRTPGVTGVTKIQASSEELNLGRAFHFTNIRFLPGVWQNAMHHVAYGQIETRYTGDLPLNAASKKLSQLPNFTERQPLLIALVEQLIAGGIVVANPVTETIFTHLEDITSVADMAEVCEISPRQLQRTLKRTTGFTPHDFFKVLRLQQSLLGEPSLSYADQSHFIHSFKKATGYTPAKYARKFDV